MRAERADLERLDRQLEIVDRARRARPVQHVVHGPVDVDVLRDVVADELESRGSRRCAMLAMSPVSEIVDADDGMTAIEQRFAEMGSDEAGGAGDDGSWHGVRSGALEQTADEREPHDLEVERHRPVLDVVEVVLDALLERRVAAPAVDLRPAGDARP